MLPGEGVVPEQADEAQEDAAGGRGEDEPGDEQAIFAQQLAEQCPPREQVERRDRRGEPVRQLHRHGDGRRVRE